MNDPKSEHEKIIREFLPDAVPQIISRHSGELNRVVIFKDKSQKFATSGQEFALRIKKKPFPSNNLIFEKDFLDALCALNTGRSIELPVAVPKIYPTASGTAYAEDSENFYTLMSRVPGKQRFKSWYDSHLFSDDDIAQGFRVLGHLHNAYRKINILDTKKAPNVFALLKKFEKKFTDLGELERKNAKGKLIQEVKNQCDFISSKIEQIRADLTEYDYQNLPLFPVHYDINYTNVLWENKKIVSLLDFDWAQFSTLEFDFAQMCKLTCGRFGITGHSNLFDKKRLALAISAYNSTSENKINERLLIPLLDVSSLFLAHWALDTFLNEKQNEEYYLSFFKTGMERLGESIA